MYPSDLPSSIAGFTPTALLGRGAFGAVYRARHHALDIDVAIKQIDIHKLADGDVGKVLREARLMARLDHPNLLRVLDAGQSGDFVYLVLELMDGGSCKGLRSLPAADALDVTRQLLSGLQALHDARVLHRDIKPANCLRRARDGRVKLADLGIAAEWQTGAGYDFSGTLPYMAPELYESPPRVGPATDLYALGVTLACMLLPDDPFPSGPALREWILSGPRPRLTEQRPDLPAPLTALIDRMMARAIDDRPASAAEALAALTDITTPEPAPRAPAVSYEELASTVPLQETVRRTDRVGMWVLGERSLDNAFWLGHVVHHAHTGQAARLRHLQPPAVGPGVSEAILDAADRASRLSHPHIVEVIDWGWHVGRAFVVTATQGRSLRDVVDGGRPLDEPTAVAFMAAVADALVYLHDANLVHQLIEPGAISLGGDARSVQLDWPVFCAPTGSHATDPKGMPRRFYLPLFAPPDVFFAGGEGTIEPSADMYGLGASFYYLLTGLAGYRKFEGGSLQSDVRAVMPALTARFARLINSLLAFDPHARPTAITVRTELGTIARQLGIPLGSQAGGPG